MSNPRPDRPQVARRVEAAVLPPFERRIRSPAAQERPAEVEPVIFTPLGYPADTPGQKVRKPLSDLVRFEHW